MAAATWLAGVSECKITPPVGAPLLGPIQRSKGIHDDLFARVLVLSDGTNAACIAGLDLIGMDFSTADEIRRGIRRRTGIYTHLLNCSHTHSAPFTIPWSVLGWNWFIKEGQTWRQEVINKVINACDHAAANLVKVDLRCGRTDVQIGVNRRLPTPSGIVMKPNPQGVVIPWTDFLYVDDIYGRPLCVLFSHPAHPLIVHASSNLVSADYVGAAVQEIRTHLGASVLPIFLQGCAANINADPLRGGFNRAEEAGKRLAAAVLAGRERSERIPITPLEVSHRTLLLPLQELPTLSECDIVLREAEEKLPRISSNKLSEEILWKLQDEIDLGQITQDGDDDVQPMESQPWWLYDTVMCLKDLRSKAATAQSQSVRFEIQSIRTSDTWSLTAMTHELFAELQLWYETVAPAHCNILLSYTNACESYIPPDSALLEGGYEAASFPCLNGASLRYHYRLAIKPGAERQIQDALRSLWPTAH